MDLLIGTYTEGTDALGIYGVVVSSERSSQAIALDIPVRNPSFLAIHPSLPILYVVEELGEGRRRPRQCVFLERQRVFSFI